MGRRRLTGTLAAALAVVATACSLAARRHPCYPYVAHEFGGRVPRPVVQSLAREGDARRIVGRSRAPTGFYWRKARPPTGDPRDIRLLTRGYELAACPGRPRPPATPQ